jgi:hypothetical protein
LGWAQQPTFGWRLSGERFIDLNGGQRLARKPGEGRVEACMKAHVADVSDACKVALANAAAGKD